MDTQINFLTFWPRLAWNKLGRAILSIKNTSQWHAVWQRPFDEKLKKIFPKYRRKISQMGIEDEKS